MDKICGSKLSALEGFHCSSIYVCILLQCWPHKLWNNDSTTEDMREKERKQRERDGGEKEGIIQNCCGLRADLVEQ